MILRGVISDAVAVVIVWDARLRRGAVHHLANLQHGLGAVRLLFHQQGGAVLGDDGGVEPRFAATADAQQRQTREGQKDEKATNHENLGNLGGLRAKLPQLMAGP